MNVLSTLFHLWMLSGISLHQTTFEKNVAKGEISQNVLFLRSPQCLQLYSIIVLSLSFHNFDLMFSKSSAADLLYVVKG